jgi:hypothetical protein
MAMKDFSTILLINTLRATVDHLQQSAEIEQASPGVKDLKHTLRAQIVRLQGSDPEPRRIIFEEVPQARNGF